MVLIWLLKGVFYNFFLLCIKMSECNSIESAYLTYYQRNQDVILNRAKDCYENDKARLRGQDRDTETYLKKKKIKRENMGRIDFAI